MRAQAKGRWVDEAIQSMLLPNRVAASVLHQHGATACTDVTGFGLLGHLIEMIQYEESGLTDAEDSEGVAGKAPAEENAVELWLSEVPTLPGATECIEAGIVSSLQPQVRRCMRHCCVEIGASTVQFAYSVVMDCRAAQNVRCARAVANVEFGAGKAAYPLLFDPQVSSHVGACRTSTDFRGPQRFLFFLSLLRTNFGNQS
jgi:hypothetical protein